MRWLKETCVLAPFIQMLFAHRSSSSFSLLLSFSHLPLENRSVGWGWNIAVNYRGNVECASVSLSPSLSTSPGVSLRLANARPPLPSRPWSFGSIILSLSCYSASIDSGMDHLIHPICIPLMLLPVGRGMSAPTRRAARAQCRTYGIVYPRSRSLDIRPLNFHKSGSPPILHGKVYLIRARSILGAFRSRWPNRILE